MSKKNYEFDGNTYADDWNEYKKVSKKKTKHREDKNLKSSLKNYSIEKYDDYEESIDRKARNW